MNIRWPELRELLRQLDAAEDNARALVTGLDEHNGCRRPASDSWSVAECLDHLATTNEIYLRAMEKAAIQAKAKGRSRTAPAKPGLLGGWFVRLLEPPAKARVRASAKILPAPDVRLSDAFAAFAVSQNKVRGFVETYADLDLAGVRFVNPLVGALRFSLATGLHVIAAHERRHLAQAWKARERLKQLDALTDGVTAELSPERRAPQRMG